MGEGILSTIGGTPLIKLSRIFKYEKFNIYAKLEGFNPGGSIKDRTALYIIKDAMERGILRSGSTIVESSSGNLGIGLAQICLYYGLRFICVIDAKTTSQNREILRAYGAEIDCVTEPDPVTGEFLQARINRVKELLLSIDGGFWPNQYANICNPLSHHITMNEIVSELNGEVDYLFCATSTCGTMRGCAEYRTEHGLKTRIIAVDAVGSVIFGDKAKKRLIPGHGAAVMPALFQDDLADECVHVTDLECVVGCRRLVREESIMAGGSSGAVLMAIEKFKDRIPKNSNCVAILPDRGERYLDTVYSDHWVEKHFGNISELVHHGQLIAGERGVAANSGVRE